MITLLWSSKFIEEISSDFSEILGSSFCKKRKRDLPIWLLDIPLVEHEEKTKREIKVKITRTKVLNNQLSSNRMIMRFDLSEI